MANNQFDRAVINVRERPLSTDINQLQSQLDRTVRHILDQMFLGRTSNADARADPAGSSGFVGDAFSVREASPAALEVTLAAGLGFQVDASDTPSAIGGVASVDDLSRYKPLPLTEDITINVPAPDPTLDRIDIIEVNFNRRLTDNTTRDVLNTVTGAFDPTSVNKTLAFALSSTDSGVVTAPADNIAAIGYKAGIPSGTPAIPSTSPGYLKIAEIEINNGVATIIEENIKDLRNILAMYSQRSLQAEVDTNGVPTLVNLRAPPGVRVAVNTTGGVQRLYVAAGDVQNAAPACLVGYVGGAPSTILAADCDVVNVTAALKADLQNAAETVPLLNVPDDTILPGGSGQPLLRVDITQGDAAVNKRIALWW